jgi:hypothetical protein
MTSQIGTFAVLGMVSIALLVSAYKMRSHNRSVRAVSNTAFAGALTGIISLAQWASGLYRWTDHGTGLLVLIGAVAFFGFDYAILVWWIPKRERDSGASVASGGAVGGPKKPKRLHRTATPLASAILGVSLGLCIGNFQMVAAGIGSGLSGVPHMITTDFSQHGIVHKNG